jgi:pyruvate ferredoxin oxidoreductase beta subunit
MSTLEALKGVEKVTPKTMPEYEGIAPGHRACQGCGEIAALRMCVKAAGPNTIVVSSTGCMEVVSTPYPQSMWETPWIHAAFENGAAVASGVEAALKILHKKGKIKQSHNILVFAGDGGTADIGMQALSGALERGHNLTYICLDNEAYMNTGIQRSSATPFGAATTTSPAGAHSIGQVTWKKNVAAIAAAHNIPYVATAAPAFHLDLMNKVRRSLAAPGAAYIHIFAPCPTGWRCPPELSIETSRMAVNSRVFPLYEVVDGVYSLSRDVPKPIAVADYLKPQRRFSHLQPQHIAYIQERVDREWARLQTLVQIGKA